MLLVGAGLFTTTVAHLRANDTSLRSQRIVFARAYREPGDRELLPPGYYRALVTELARMPGADAAALSVYYPTYFGLKVTVPTDYHYTRADGVTPRDGTVLTDFVSPGFFDLFRFHVVKGRDVSYRANEPPDTAHRRPSCSRYPVPLSTSPSAKSSTSPAEASFFVRVKVCGTEETADAWRWPTCRVWTRPARSRPCGAICSAMKRWRMTSAT